MVVVHHFCHSCIDPPHVYCVPIQSDSGFLDLCNHLEEQRIGVFNHDLEILFHRLSLNTLESNEDFILLEWLEHSVGLIYFDLVLTCGLGPSKLSAISINLLVTLILLQLCNILECQALIFEILSYYLHRNGTGVLNVYPELLLSVYFHQAIVQDRLHQFKNWPFEGGSALKTERRAILDFNEEISQLLSAL